MTDNNTRLYASNLPSGYTISVNSIQNAINVTNNKAAYYASMALQYKNDSHEFMELAKYYAEQNSDITMSNLRDLESRLQTAIDLKQNAGNYVTETSLENTITALQQDENYALQNAINTLRNEVKLPEQTSNSGKFLTTNGSTASWENVILRNIGEIVFSTIPLTDAGLHLLDGSLISGSGVYSAFVDYISDLYDSGNYSGLFATEANWQSAVTAYGVCGKFVYDSVNNTVRLPKYSNKIWTQNITQNNAPVVGNGTSLGLTNGTTSGALCDWATAGYMGISSDQFGSAVGTTRTTTTNSNKTFGVTTNASKSGLIAQLSNITTSLNGYYYIVIATNAKTNIQVDIDEIATDLNGKADVDLTNLANAGKIAIAHNALPSNTKYYNYSAGASGSTYTAPSDGYLMVNGSSTNTNDTLVAVCSNTSMQVSARGGANSYMRVFLPVSKGTQVTINYTSGVTMNYIRLIYAAGSESEAV